MKFCYAFLLVCLLGLGACKATGNAEKELTAQDLMHHRFEIVSLNNAPLSGQKDAPSEISFNEDMNVSGKACNRFRGKATLANGVITMPNAVSTKMFCAEDDLNKLETALFALLSQGATVSLEGERLTLSGKDTVIVFQQRDLVQ